MATNDDLDDFFKKKDRKGNKHKKQSGLLTNNQELLKQLEIVTSATTAFKENLEFDEDDEGLPINDEPTMGTIYPSEETRKHPIKSSKTKLPESNHKNANDSELILSHDGQQQQDEWEDFEYSNDKYEQLRLKFASATDDNDDEYYDDEGNLHNNEDNSDLTGDRQQNKEKPAWKIDQIRKEQETNAPVVEEKSEEIQPAKPAAPTGGSSGVYRPPHSRGGSSVTVITSVNNQRTTKKKEPNLSSIDEFPTLGATVNKK